MIGTLSSVASLLLAGAVMLLGGSLLGLILPLKMRAAGFPAETTGLVMAAYFGGLLAGSLYGKRLIGEVGHIRAFAGFAAIMAASVVAYPLLFEPLSWGLLRLIQGFCIAGLFAVLESWLNDRTDNARRGRVLGVYMIVNYAAIMSGQLMVNLWDIGGQEGFLMAAMLAALCLVPVVLTRLEAPDLAEIKPLNLRQLYAASPLAVVAACASGLMMGGYYGMGAIFASDLGFDVLWVSLFTSSVILGGLSFQWPIGRLSDRLDRRTVLLGLLVVLILVCAGGMAWTAAQGPAWPLLGLGLVLGATMTAVYPISVAQAFDYLPRDRYVAASSGLLLAYSAGATAGPIASAGAMGVLGPSGFFAFLGAVGAASAAFVLYRMQARAPLPAEQQEAFVAVPRMSPVVGELDPRAEAPEEPKKAPPPGGVGAQAASRE